MGAAAAYVRSWRLTSGSFWRLSAIYTVALIVLFVLYALTSGVTGVLIGVLGRGDVALIAATLGVVFRSARGVRDSVLYRAQPRGLR